MSYLLRGTALEDTNILKSLTFFGTIHKVASKVEFSAALEALRSLPCPYVQFDINGTIEYFNPAFQNLFKINNPDEVLGKMNAFTSDKFEGLDVTPWLRQVYHGETIFHSRLTPAVAKRFSEFIPMGPDLLIFFVSSCLFPILDSRDNVVGVGVLLYPQHNRAAEKPADKVKRYIDEHWVEPYDFEKIAVMLSLNPDYLAKIFKREYGSTPFDYYRLVKLLHLKDKLCQPNTNVQGAFSECGLKYTGTAAGYFKKKVGMTPNEYRRKYCQSEDIY